MHFRAFVPVLTITIGACVCLTACGHNDKEVSFKSGGMTHTFAEGTSAKTDSFPLPIYPNAKPSGSVSANGDGNEACNFMMLSTTDNLNQVSEFYSRKLKDAGWIVNSTTSMPSMVNISASKSNLEANVMIGLDSDKTNITLAFNRESTEPTKTSTETYTPDKLNPPTD